MENAGLKFINPQLGHLLSPSLSPELQAALARVSGAPAGVSRASANSCPWPFVGPGSAHACRMGYPQEGGPVDTACVDSANRLGLFAQRIPGS